MKKENKINRFVFIIPFRNAANFINECAMSLIKQKNENWIAIFCDDASNDEGIKFIPDDRRFTINRNYNRITALPNIHNNIINSRLNNEDIICILDGDDALIRSDAIDILLTYGQYVWPNGQVGHCKSYTREEFLNLRNGGYWASHMRTFKYKLYKELLKQDPFLSCFKNSKGEFYTITYDVAIMTPLMEIAGFERIKFNKDPIYYYRIHQQTT